MGSSSYLYHLPDLALVSLDVLTKLSINVYDGGSYLFTISYSLHLMPVSGVIGEMVLVHSFLPNPDHWYLDMHTQN